MKKKLLIMLTALLSLTMANAADPVSVFLTAGQSNTDGRCMNENLPDYIKALGSSYKYCNWSYTNGGSRTSAQEGVFRKYWPEMSSTSNNGRFAYDAFVYYWIEQALQKDFYVIKHSYGGTSIDPTCTSSNDYHWSADASWLAENTSCNEGGKSMLKAFCSNIDKSLDAITASGKTYDIKCMIWHQGESDRSGTGPDGYHDNLKAVVKYVRDYLVSKTGNSKYATLPFICGTVPTNSKQYNKKVYNALFTLQDEDANFHVIETSPGTFIGDDLHFDANCAERLGIGMYNKMVDLGLVSGSKQTVPDANVPVDKTITLDFSTWTKENLDDKSTTVTLTAESTSSLKTIDGSTSLYKITGSDDDGDFSEFAETFALGTPSDILLRGGGHGLFANKKTSVFSLLNLTAGDTITVTTNAGDGGAALKFLSTNAYKVGDSSKTAVVKDSVWTSGDSYVITSNTQLDLTFGRSSSCYIYKIVINPFQGGDESDDPTTTTDETGVTTNTLDFQAWTKENLDDKSTTVSLTAESTSSLKTIDGSTALYKITGSADDGDFSEFAGTFALGTPSDILLRGGGYGLFANKKTSVFSLLNLTAGDTITVTTNAGDGGAALKFLSTNAYKVGDSSKTAVVKDSVWTSGDSYVITSNTQLDLTFGRSSSCYIYKIVIKHSQETVETDTPTTTTDEPTKKVTVHTIGDSTMSSYDQSIAAQQGMDGWGDYLIDCLKSDWATVYNWADRGESAKSYYNGIWLKTSSDRPEFAEPIANKVKSGDYVIIQFGHNDSKAYSTVQYEQWLGTLVDAVKAKGATPIIASSICRARFGSDGKITRIGRIDTYEESGRIAESGATINDYTFDYPYHAKQVADAKGVEFIDVTSAVKELFESYGEAKTKALFPSGEKTHTNKTGAQTIAKLAANLLLGTSLKDYVDTDAITVPSADDVAVVIDNFGSEAVVTKKTIWTFNNYSDGDEIAEASNTGNNIVEMNGLYARSYTSRGINAVTSSVSKVTFSDDDATEVKVSIAAQTQSNHNAGENIFGQNTAGRAAASALAPTFALNVGTPGTFYCILAPTKTNSDRYERVIFSGKGVDSVAVATAWANTNHLCELKYHAATTGVIYLSAGITSNFYAMMFIPDMEAGTEEDWNYQMVMTRENGYWTYSNLSGNDQSVPEGLTAYAVSKVDANGKAVLTSIGDVIPSGMGVVVKGDPNTEYALPTVANTAKGLNTSLAAAYSGDNLLKSNTELRYLPATENSNTNYYFDGSQFVKATGGETIHEKQAYLSVPNDADAITLTIDVTGITNINNNTNLNVSDNYVYDLSGRRIAKQNLAKGIYIINGKKVKM